MSIVPIALVLAALLFGLARWGRKNSADLVSVALSAESRAKRERVLRRGAMSCYVLAALFVALALLHVLDAVTE